MRKMFLRIAIAVICISVQMSVCAPKSEARNFFDVLLGISSILLSSDKPQSTQPKKSVHYVSGDMPDDGTPVKLQEEGIVQNRWVGTHRINLQEPAEIILTAANYRPLLVEHRLYDSHDVELGMMSPYEGMEDTISRMLASGSYVIRSYSSALCYSGKMDCELRMQKNEFSFRVC